jgi:hypothetical protein
MATQTVGQFAACVVLNRVSKSIGIEGRGKKEGAAPGPRSIRVWRSAGSVFGEARPLFG